MSLPNDSLTSITHLDLPAIIFPGDQLAIDSFTNKLSSKAVSQFLIDEGQNLLTPEEEQKFSELAGAEEKLNYLYQIVEEKSPNLTPLLLNYILETKAEIVVKLLLWSDKNRSEKEIIEIISNQKNLVQLLEKIVKSLTSDQINSLI